MLRENRNCAVLVSVGIENPLLCCRAEKVLNSQSLDGQRQPRFGIAVVADAQGPLWTLRMGKSKYFYAHPSEKTSPKQLFETKIVDMTVSGLGGCSRVAKLKLIV